MEQRKSYDINVSIIIIDYNATDLLINAVKSIKTYTLGIKYEIIVVDNASPDHPFDKLLKALPKDVILIQSKQNLGFGGANNLAARHAHGKYLFLLNPDTLLQDNAIYKLWTFAEKHQNQKIGALGTILVDIKGNPVNSYGKFIKPFDVIKRSLKLKHDPKVNFIRERKSVDFITGADLFITAKLYKELNGFDEDFFMYCEETDLQFRMSLKGYARIIIPQGKIIHYEGGSYEKTQKRSAKRRLQYDISQLRYIKKHYNLLIYNLFRIFFFLCRIPAFINPHYTCKENKEYLLMQLKGI